jgi:hypothetical protein
MLPRNPLDNITVLWNLSNNPPRFNKTPAEKIAAFLVAPQPLSGERSEISTEPKPRPWLEL